MKIEDIIEILFNGNKTEIKKVLIEQKVSYSFSNNLEAYTVKSLSTLEVSRGYKPRYKPNCVKYFGYEYNYKE